jgi:hypothetical protein
VTGYTGLGFDPVPGDAARVAALADAMTAAGTHAEDARDQVTGALAASRPWHGTAAEEFRRRATDVPARLAGHRDVTASAADALFDWASTLADLRRRAEELDRRARTLRSRVADAEQAVEQWQTAVSVASTHTRAAAEATLAGHEHTLTGLRTELATVLDSAHRLAGEHRAAADRTTQRLRALAPTGPAGPPAPAAGAGTGAGAGAVLTGLAAATRRAAAAAGLTAARPAGPPPAGAVAAAVAAPAEPAAGTWVFGRSVPASTLVAALAGDRRT